MKIKNIKLIRLSQGYTRKELAKKTGLTLAAISHIENGTRQGSWASILKIVNVLNVSLDELFGRIINNKKEESIDD